MDTIGSFKTKASQGLSRLIMKVFGIVLIMGISGGGVYWGIRYNPGLFGIKGPENIEAEVEVQKVVSQVEKIITLPDNEIPTLATVTDVEKVKGQPFFKNAQTGDKVLVYAQSRKAYLYRPSEKKLIEVGAINISQGVDSSPSPSAFVGPTWVPSITNSPTP